MITVHVGCLRVIILMITNSIRSTTGSEFVVRAIDGEEIETRLNSIH